MCKARYGGGTVETRNVERIRINATGKAVLWRAGYEMRAMALIKPFLSSTHWHWASKKGIIDTLNRVRWIQMRVRDQVHYNAFRVNYLLNLWNDEIAEY